MVRQLFHQLKVIGTRLHADLGITIAMRGVLETIERHGPTSVPRMARMRPVSRQHIQRVVDELLERKLVRLETNPHHKLSPLVSMTDKGHAAFQAMSQRERPVFGQLARGLSADEVEITRRVLDQLRMRLTQMRAKQGQMRRDDHEDHL
jgi:DNA-binding MarR family transcriptional regulator